MDCAEFYVAALGVGAGLIVASLVLARQDRRLPPARSPSGALAVVTHVVRPGGTGEVMIAEEGRRWLPARSAAQRSLSRGAEVVVVDYAAGVAEVALLDDDGRDASDPPFPDPKGVD
jgi:hypothetical protein